MKANFIRGGGGGGGVGGAVPFVGGGGRSRLLSKCLSVLDVHNVTQACPPLSSPAMLSI